MAWPESASGPVLTAPPLPSSPGSAAWPPASSPGLRR
jgi:hypothetical protein